MSGDKLNCTADLGKINYTCRQKIIHQSDVKYVLRTEIFITHLRDDLARIIDLCIWIYRPEVTDHLDKIPIIA
ncbi:hypothetical protein D3C81_2194070 [compost metagenome]